MAGRVRYLLYRDGRYYARLVIPRELRPFLDNKVELRTPLGGDRRAALAKLPGAVAALQHQIGTAEQKALNAGREVTTGRYPMTPTEIAQREYETQIAFDLELRQHDNRYAELGVDLDRAHRLRDGYSGKLSDNELEALVGDRIGRLRRAGSVEAAKGSSEWRAVAQGLCLAQYEAMERQFERDEGDFTGQPTHPLLTQPIAEQEPETVITFKQIIDDEVKHRARGKDAKPLSSSAEKSYRNATDDFARHRKSKNAATVTIEEGEAWRDAMLDSGELANSTIKQNLQNVTTVINWGQKRHRGTFHPSENPMSKVERPDFRQRPSYLKAFTEDEAKMVLRAARNEELSFLRWIPWLCAYSGMRVQEAGGLRKEDFFQYRDRWFYRVTTIGGRRLKNEGSERRIPVHQALIDEGLIEFVEAAPEGWLFLGVLGEKINVQPRMSEWVRAMIPYEKRPDLQPNHGWRHLFEDFCRRDLVLDDARKYITGRNDGGSSDLYGKSDVMLLGLAKAMDMVEAIELG